MDDLGNSAHVRRERERARELRKSRWWQTLISQSACYYCGQQLVAGAVTMDHVVPLTQGGASTPGNLVPACKPCNSAKRDMTAVEWLLHVEAARQVPS